MKKKTMISINAGHNGKGTGASRLINGKWFDEGEMTIELRNLVKQEILRLDPDATVIVDDDSLSLPALINRLKKILGKTDIAVDLHFNASNNPAHNGASVFVSKNASKEALELAKSLSEAITVEFGCRNNGVQDETKSYHGKLGFVNLCPIAVLVEVRYISSPVDMMEYAKNKNKIAASIAAAIVNFAKRRLQT